MSFASFRDRLDTSSGFQSIQFRELEFVLGYKRRGSDSARSRLGPGSTLGRKPGWREPSVVDALLRFLAQHGVDVPAASSWRRDVTEADRARTRRVQDGSLRLYRSQPELAILFELMTDFDEGLPGMALPPRQAGGAHHRHQAGHRRVAGVEFLKESLFQPIFPDLWAIRHRI